MHAHHSSGRAALPAVIAKALAALAVLTTLIVGPPTLLVHFVGNPLPTLAHTRLTSALSDDELVAALSMIIWLAWAQFVGCVMIEVASRAGRARRPRLRVGFGFQRQLAAALVTSILALGPVLSGMTAGVAHAAPATTVSQPHAATRAFMDADRPAPRDTGAPSVTTTVARPSDQNRTVMVRPGDTLWSLAQTHLGDGQRWREVFDANAGRAQSDGAALSDPQLLHPGWVLALPPSGPAQGDPAAADVVEVSVEPGDTIYALARRYLGDGDQWPAIWRLNAGRVQPDGRRASDPALLRPGWVLSIPATPTTRLGAAAQAGSVHAGSSTGPASAADSAVTGPEVTLAAAPATDAATAAGGDVTPAPQSSPQLPGPADGAAGPRTGNAGLHQRVAPAREAHEPGMAIVAFAGAGWLLAAGTLAALMRARRRQFRHRRPGRTTALSVPELVGLERALLGTGGAKSADVTWLNRALRGLAHRLAGTGQPLPDVVAAKLGENGLELVLASPGWDAPSPWTVSGDGLSWSLPAGADPGFDLADAVWRFAPYPTLATVGVSEAGEHVLLDLERIGALSLAGDAQSCLALARFIAAELAHNVWSEHLQVTLVGFGKEMAELNPQRLTYSDDADAAIAALTADLDVVTQVSEQAGADVLEARVGGGVGDGWPPHVVLIAPQVAADDAGLGRLLEAMQQRPDRRAVALVLTGEREAAAPARWQLRVDEHGLMSIPALGVRVFAQQLPDHEAADLARLIALASDTADAPMPPAAGEVPWQRHADAAGAPRPEFTIGRPGARAGLAAVPDRPVEGLADTAPWQASILPLNTGHYLAVAATTGGDIATLGPGVADQVRRGIEDADPTLDEDVAVWHDEQARVAKLRLLGPITLTAWGKPPAKRIAYYTELVAYLATRDHGATLDQLGTSLHPDDPDIANKTTVRNAASIARAWLGVHPGTGRDYLPQAGAGRALGVYEVRDVLVDAELFRRLRVRGVARGAGGIADLRAALNLVAGVPFDRQRPGGYSWLVDAGAAGRLDFVYAAMIVDVAHTLATYYLGAGDPGQAVEVARAALRAGASDDVALLDLVVACDALGNRAEADAYVRQLMDNHDAAVPEDLPPRTYEVLLRRERSA